jgi:fatty-acid desaturase
MSLNRSHTLRVFHVVNHIALGYGLFQFSPAWLLLSVFCWFLFGCLGISIGYHRLLSHRSFTPTPLGYYLTSLLGCLATGGSPLTWVGAHRLHHTHPDKKGDPHSGLVDGWLRVYFHVWKPFLIKRCHLRDLLKDPFQRSLHRHYFLIIISYILLLSLFGREAVIFAYCVPAVMAFHAFGLINTFGHFHGYRSYDVKDNSTNSWVANLLTWGEGWHNNHHKSPSSYRIGRLKYEWDISAWVIEHIPYIAISRNRLKKN